MKMLVLRVCFLAACCTLFACQKDPSVFGTTFRLQDLELGKNASSTTKNTVIDTLLPHLTERFVVNPAEKNLQIRSTKGTILHIPTEAFIRKDGSVVQNGTVTLFIREIHRPSEIILLDKPTNTEGGYLESFGEFHVTAFADNQPLELRNNASIRIETPIFSKNTPRQMPVWEADTTLRQTLEGLNPQAEAITADHVFTTNQGSTWRRDLTSKAYVNADEKLEFELMKLNTWKNCDVFYTDPRPKTTLLVHFSQHYTPSVKTDEFSAVYFKPDGRNTLIKLFRPILNAPDGKKGFHSETNTLPIGMMGKLIALTRQNNRFFVASTALEIKPNTNESSFMAADMRLNEVNRVDFLEKLKELDQ